MNAAIRLQREYDVPVEELWDLVATREGLAEWLMPNDFAPVAGHRFTFVDRPRPPLFDGVVACRVTHVEPPRLLRLTWAGGPVDTVVTFALTAVGPERTRLELTQTGFTGVRGGLVRGILGLGWRRLLGRSVPRALAARREP